MMDVSEAKSNNDENFGGSFDPNLLCTMLWRELYGADNFFMPMVLCSKKWIWISIAIFEITILKYGLFVCITNILIVV
jgi:hypothetical protein